MPEKYDDIPSVFEDMVGQDMGADFDNAIEEELEKIFRDELSKALDNENGGKTWKELIEDNG